MDEYGGYLYIHSCHTMYTSSDGLNHQANLSFSVREADMEITDSFSGVANISAGYVSHSFNQFILVDQDANIVTLDHSDAYPRGRRSYATAPKPAMTNSSPPAALIGASCRRMWSSAPGPAVSARMSPAPRLPAWRRPAPVI